MTEIEKTRSDHVLAFAKAGVAGIPIVGGPIASLRGDYVSTHSQKSIELSFNESSLKK